MRLNFLRESKPPLFRLVLLLAAERFSLLLAGERFLGFGEGVKLVPLLAGEPPRPPACLCCCLPR